MTPRATLSPKLGHALTVSNRLLQKDDRFLPVRVSRRKDFQDRFGMLRHSVATVSSKFDDAMVIKCGGNRYDGSGIFAARLHFKAKRIAPRAHSADT